jgi:1-acyl-sn-glycerol-3-phosphate acyltransferase
MGESTKPPNATLWRSLAYTVFRAFFKFLFRVVFRMKWHGRENVPLTGPVLIVANHQSYIDPPAIGCGMKRHSAYLGRAGLFKNPVLAYFLRLFNVFPLNEEGGDIAAMRAVLSILKQGHSVVIFPEGSRCEDGEIAPFKRGAEIMLKRAKCPVIPAAIDGAYEAWPRSSKRPRLFNRGIRIIYGQPIAHVDLFDPEAEGTVTDRLEQEVRKLHAQLHDTQADA